MIDCLLYFTIYTTREIFAIASQLNELSCTFISLRITRNVLFMAGLVCIGIFAWDFNRPYDVKSSEGLSGVATPTLLFLICGLAGVVLLIVAFRIHKKIKREQILRDNFLKPTTSDQHPRQ